MANKRLKSNIDPINDCDHTVGGSLITGETPFECLVREAHEEASFDTGLTRSNATGVGTISYLCLTDERSRGEKGLLCPEVQFLYEMRMSIDQLKGALATGEFTPANREVIQDLFIRHGILTFENEPNYVSIVSRLHHSLELIIP